MCLFFLGMGCTTAAGRIIYVDVDANGLNDGSSWENAYNFLQNAVADANSAGKPVEIWVAQGIYKPDQGVGITPGDRTATFQLINGVTLQGGYAGFGQPDPNARDIELYETILSGDLDGDDVEVGDPCDLRDERARAENSYHVSTANGTDPSAILNGLTIAGGNANHVPHSPMWDFTKIRGGGVYNEHGSAVFGNCTFVGNFAGGGGGIYNKGGDLLLVNCSFVGNCARPVFDPVWGWSGNGSGGGMGNRGGNPMLTDCTFSGNFASSGGGMKNSGGGPTLRRCTFSGNSAIGGGGMYNGGGNAALTNCTFTGNLASTGGGMKDNFGYPVLVNCKFIGNSAWAGGGIFFMQSCCPESTQTATNCIFSGNSAEYGGGVYSTYDDLILANCTFSSNSATYGGGLFNDISDLILTNCILWGNMPEQISGNAVVSYSDVEGGWWPFDEDLEDANYWGMGNIDADPLFVDPNNGDYYLKSEGWRWESERKVWTWDEVTSPCIDAGNAGSPLRDELLTIPDDPNNEWGENVRINMGAFGGTAEASMALPGWGLLADLTNDRIVDFNDVAVFVQYWVESGDCIPSDLNRNESVDFADFALIAFHWLEKK